MTIAVKVCGITRVADALVAAEAGAQMIGLNFWPGSPRCVGLAQAAEIIEAVAGRVRVVGLFVESNQTQIEETTGRLGIRTVQLHGVNPALAQSLHGLEVIQAFPVAREEDLRAVEGFPAALCLLDARVPGMHGGTGQPMDWSLARRAAAARRILLAGGLTPDNVGEAIRAVRPWGVDAASGLETQPGIKDADRVRSFVRAANQAAKDLDA
jgi:phosphoribosylanthranilate isomerase